MMASMVTTNVAVLLHMAVPHSPLNPSHEHEDQDDDEDEA